MVTFQSRKDKKQLVQGKQRRHETQTWMVEPTLQLGWEQGAGVGGSERTKQTQEQGCEV